MSRQLRLLVLALAAALALAVGGMSPAAAAPSCVAQSVQLEHEIYGTSWGPDVIAFLASNRAVLRELGFDSFGDLASFAAAQDPAACPPEL